MNPTVYYTFPDSDTANWQPFITGAQSDVGLTQPELEDAASVQRPHDDHAMTDRDTGYYRQIPADHTIDRYTSLQSPRPPRRAVHLIGQDINHYLARPGTETIQAVLSDYENWMRTQNDELTLLCHYCKDFSRYLLFLGVSDGNPRWIEHNLLDTIFRPESEFRAWWGAEMGEPYPHHSESKWFAHFCLVGLTSSYISISEGRCSPAYHECHAGQASPRFRAARELRSGFARRSPLIGRLQPNQVAILQLRRRKAHVYNFLGSTEVSAHDNPS